MVPNLKITNCQDKGKLRFSKEKLFKFLLSNSYPVNVTKKDFNSNKRQFFSIPERIVNLTSDGMSVQFTPSFPALWTEETNIFGLKNCSGPNLISDETNASVSPF
jgi:hypothetical protein